MSPTWYTAGDAKSEMNIVVTDKGLAVAREQCLREKGLSLYTATPPSESFAQGVVMQALANKQAAQAAGGDAAGELGGQSNSVRVWPMDKKIQALLIIPAPDAADVAPVTLTWDTGYALTLTRVGDVVTGVLTSSGGGPSLAVIALPTHFLPLGTVRVLEYNSPDAPTAVLAINDVPATGALGVTYQGEMPAGQTITAQWVGDPLPVAPGSRDHGRVGSLIG